MLLIKCKICFRVFSNIKLYIFFANVWPRGLWVPTYHVWWLREGNFWFLNLYNMYKSSDYFQVLRRAIDASKLYFELFKWFDLCAIISMYKMRGQQVGYRITKINVFNFKQNNKNLRLKKPLYTWLILHDLIMPVS